MLQVVAGIIEQEGHILLCQRHRNSLRFPLKWEFPGGKVEHNESPENAMIRELHEELGIKVITLEKIEDYLFNYPQEDTFHLLFYKIIAFKNSLQNLQFETMTWVKKENIKDYDLLEGDLPFVKQTYK